MKKYLYITLGILTLGIAALVVKHFNDKKDVAIEAPVLNPGIREKIIIDPRHNKITVVTKERTDKLFLPDRPTSIEIPYEGKVRIESRVWGFEVAPFGALVVTDTLRMGVGVDGFYWKKLNFGSGIGLNVPNLFSRESSIKKLLDVRFFTHASYNVWSNTSVGLVLDSNKKIGMDVSFRF